MIEQQNIHGEWEPQKKEEPRQESAFEKYHRESEESRQKSFKLGTEIKEGNLPMFMTGGEIKQHFKPLEADREGGESDNDMWNRKLTEAKEKNREEWSVRGKAARGRKESGDTYKTSLEQSIRKKKNITGFISLQPPHEGGQVLGGHHRVALAAEQFKDMIMPVKYSKDIYEAKEDPHYR